MKQDCLESILISILIGLKFLCLNKELIFTWGVHSTHVGVCGYARICTFLYANHVAGNHVNVAHRRAATCVDYYAGKYSSNKLVRCSTLLHCN